MCLIFQISLIGNDSFEDFKLFMGKKTNIHVRGNINNMPIFLIFVPLHLFLTANVPANRGS